MIYENDMYKVVVGKSIQNPDTGVVCYLVINKATEVCEMESSVLVNSIVWADNLKQEYEAVMEKKSYNTDNVIAIQ